MISEENHIILRIKMGADTSISPMMMNAAAPEGGPRRRIRGIFLKIGL
jgi:hypothetical protein